MNSLDNLGIVIKNARISQKLTREDLADKIKISPRYLMQIENQDKKPSYDVLFKIVRTLQIHTDTIFYPEISFKSDGGQQLEKLLLECDSNLIKTIYIITKSLLENSH